MTRAAARLDAGDARSDTSGRCFPLAPGAFGRTPRQVLRDAQAVEDVSFHYRPGEIVGLLGPNGAGKTTTINMILGVLEPTAGRIAIEGLDLRADRSAALDGTNFAAVYAPLPGNLTVEQNLRVFGMIYAVENLTRRIEQLLVAYDLSQFRRTKAGVLSSGEQTRLGLAKAMLNRPRLLLLDEPTASIDPSAARDIRAGIAEVVESGRCGVLWTSHNMVEVEAVCDRVLFLSHGRIVLEGDPKTLPHLHGAETLDDLFVSVAHETLDEGLQPMSRSRVAAIVLRILYLYRGSPQRVFPIFVWVMVDILLWGFLTRYLNFGGARGGQFRRRAARRRALVGLSDPRDAGRDDGVLRGRLVAELPQFFRDARFASPNISPGSSSPPSARALLSLVAMVVFAARAFGLSFLSYGVALAPFLAVLFLTGIALGVAAAALVLRLGPASEWLIWPIPMIVSPFAGVFYPVTVLPGWMQAIAALLPPSYVFEGMRAVVAGEPAPWDRLALGGGLASSISFSPASSSPSSTTRHPHRPYRPLQRRDVELKSLPLKSCDGYEEIQLFPVTNVTSNGSP